MTRHLDAAAVRAALDVGTAIASQRLAFRALGEGTAVMPPKSLVPGADGALALAYPARVSAETGPVCKFVSFNPGNAGRGLPSIHGLIVALHAETGVPVAVLDGAEVTTIRTSAASAVAVDVLSTPDSGDLAVIGCGVQGVAHVRAIAAVRPLRRVRLFSRTGQSRRAAAQTLAAELDVEVSAVDSARDAVEGADLVALCTVSTTPVVESAWLADGCTVLSVGSFEPHRSEVGLDTLRRATVVVDHLPTARAHAGPIVDGIAAGILTESGIEQLGDVLVGTSPGRTGQRDIVFYNSTGVGVQDAAAVWTALEPENA
ncbi:ornithine cyclodeaminase family protein [Amycolatopsis suaedae]|uniref:Ornithine cyclodeaminase family protein n=1 Tax=Amycolatopsis suaedae TaxID=2510978 RepID=A0A4Q7J2I4_9PSEU|nr:ornithine cyclodeaminase family protein [Amycolatopsis suaedae]RZQ60802.1 ornithine cyclodeaminase family protein [Amycolatopsis suaedae]